MHSQSKSAQKMSYKKAIQNANLQKLLLNSPDMNESHLLQTPKGGMFNGNSLVTSPPEMLGCLDSSIKGSSIYNQSEKKISPTTGRPICNCKKSKCLKLYCDCFASGIGCSPECNCCDCSNHEDKEERKLAIDAILDRNPNAFKPKI